MYEELITRLREALSEEQVKCDEPLKRYTTFRIGGPADVFVNALTPDDVTAAVRICRENGTEPVIIGNGSNLLVSDDGIRGAVIRITSDGDLMPKLLSEDEKSVTVEISAGTMLSAFSREMTNRGYVGMEFAAGIPGSVGGAVFMNAGAYGGEIKDVLKEAAVLTADGTVKTVPAEELSLSYRHSTLSENGAIALTAVFTLPKGDVWESKAIIADLSKRRKDKQPLEYPSAGSTFKRPEGYFAGKLIEDSGLRGFSVGDAQVSEKHCGFVINRKEATAEDVLRLITAVRNTVYSKFSVMLETEVRFLGDFSNLSSEVDRRIFGEKND